MTKFASRGADSGVYNVLMNAFIGSRIVNSATRLMDKMEANNLCHDQVTFHSMFLGLMKSSGINGVLELFHKMINRNFVPKTPTVVMLMKLFCKTCKVDEAFSFWNYLIERGYCPHSHAIDFLLTSLCSHGRVKDAFECSVQILEKGRHLSNNSVRVLERYSMEMGDDDKLMKLEQLIKKLHQKGMPLTFLASIGTLQHQCRFQCMLVRMVLRFLKRLCYRLPSTNAHFKTENFRVW